jgi:hypothetical protein
LKEFSRNIQREIFGVDDTFDEGEIIRDQVFAIIHDENSSDIEFDIIFFLFGFKKIERSSLRDV